MSLRIQLLGQPTISRDGNPVDLPGHRPLALLAYLILTRKACSREHLSDLFFDGPDDPRASLRWTLSKLRQAIGSESILADRHEVSFNFQSDHWLDVQAFEAGESDLYQGDLLEGLYLRDALRFEEWLLFERQRLRGKYQASLERELEIHKAQQDFAAVIITARQLLKLDNLREDWHYALMLAYARSGKRATALEQFEKCRQALRVEWDMDPAPETIALAEDIRNGHIGPDISIIESEIDHTGVTTIASERIVEPIGKLKLRYRSSLSRPALVEIGAIGLVIVLILILGRMFDINSLVVLHNDVRASNLGEEDQNESALQKYAGTTVWILGPFYDVHAKLFMQSMIPFEERSGIDINFLAGDKPYEKYLLTRLETGDLPDLVVFPQPSWLAGLAKQGKIIDISTFLSDDVLQKQYPEAFLALAKVDGQVMGVWHTADLKSLVWYSNHAFKAKGYEVPETWDELIALSDRIVADGGTPWCIGIEGADATGWVGTDWVEDILLRIAPPETYDAWVRHDLPFNSPEIRRVFEIMGQIWLNDDYVYGGKPNILNESFRDSPVHLFEDSPGCYLHKQASFAPFFFPQGVSYGRDYDFFYLPPIDPEFGKPVLGSGYIFAMFNDRPEVREVVRYLTTAESTKALIEHGGFLSPHRDTPIDWFPTAADLRFAQIILGADTYRFDGSDLMPEEVGLGSFFRGITDWVGGADLETVLQNIDNSWPR